MSDYNPQEIEPKWQAKWNETSLYRQVIDKSKPKHYAMTMLPYPSGDLVCHVTQRCPRPLHAYERVQRSLSDGF